MDKKEKLILQLMEEAEKDGEPITREEAEEMAEMEIKANGFKDYAQAQEKKPRKKREVKIDETKVDLIKKISDFLLTTEVEDVKIVNVQKEITFTFKNDIYSVSLTKHGNKWKEKNL